MLDNWSKRRPLNNIATVPIGNRQSTCCTIDDCCTTIYCLRSTTVLLVLLNRQCKCCTLQDCCTTTIYGLTVRLVLLNRQCICWTLQDCFTTTIYGLRRKSQWRKSTYVWQRCIPLACEFSHRPFSTIRIDMSLAPRDNAHTIMHCASFLQCRDNVHTKYAKYKSAMNRIDN